jgi:hypothetical protein
MTSIWCQDLSGVFETVFENENVNVNECGRRPWAADEAYFE